MKQCTGCQQTKPLDQFYHFANGISSQCKPCRRLAVRRSQIRMAERTGGAIPPPGTLVRCHRCKAEKPMEAFGRNKSKANGLQAACRVCAVAAVTKSRHKDPTSHRASSKAWREANPERHADNSLSWRYGIEHGTYAKLLAQQEGKCAICQTTKPGTRLKRFHVDHCHDTAQVRGLLCENCNKGIGMLMHREDLLKSAIDYLTKTSEKSGE